MKQRILPLLLALALILAGCTAGGGGTEPLQLYFPVAEKAETGTSDALGTLSLKGEAYSAEELVRLLLAGPGENSSLENPFPAGTELRSCTLEDGELHVDLSERYGRLSGVDLTLADYCLTLTLCQLTEVERVRITSGGWELPYRSDQSFAAEDVLTDRDILPAEAAE